MSSTTTLKPEKSPIVPADDGGTFQPPPPAGSNDEALATAKVVGWPGAFCRTSKDVEFEILSLLLWEM